ncbi:MAG: hypothetical protein R3C11_12825 [Planctomycetaceae bacterium]
MNTLIKKISIIALAVPVMAGIPAVLAGCDNKETILDVETPDGELEVERDKDTGSVDVEVEKNE